MEIKQYDPALIRKIRDAKGDTREEFGQLFGVSKHTVTSWEQGARTPSKAVALLLDGLVTTLRSKGIRI